MNRVIKFRGKKIDNNEWVYGGYFSSSEEEGLVHYIFCSINGAEPVILETIGQFSGSKDKKGIDIYENDICNSGYFKLHIVDFWRNGFHFKCSNFDSHHSFETAKHTFEVIGNIFDNKELIENRGGCH